MLLTTTGAGKEKKKGTTKTHPVTISWSDSIVGRTSFQARPQGPAVSQLGHGLVLSHGRYTVQSPWSEVGMRKQQTENSRPEQYVPSHAPVAPAAQKSSRGRRQRHFELWCGTPAYAFHERGAVNAHCRLGEVSLVYSQRRSVVAHHGRSESRFEYYLHPPRKAHRYSTWVHSGICTFDGTFYVRCVTGRIGSRDHGAECAGLDGDSRESSCRGGKECWGLRGNGSEGSREGEDGIVGVPTVRCLVVAAAMMDDEVSRALVKTNQLAWKCYRVLFSIFSLFWYHLNMCLWCAT